MKVVDDVAKYLAREQNDIRPEEIIQKYCPRVFGYTLPASLDCTVNGNHLNCTKCWNCEVMENGRTCKSEK